MESVGTNDAVPYYYRCRLDVYMSPGSSLDGILTSTSGLQYCGESIQPTPQKSAKTEHLQAANTI
jgi:hypothetical protein